MEQQNDVLLDEVTTELQALVVLVDANVSPIADAEAWEAEIAAHQHGERGDLSPPVNQTLQEVIELASTLA